MAITGAEKRLPDAFSGLTKGSDEMGVIGHGWTYSAHPLCAAAGIANLELIDKLGLVDNAGEVGAQFRKGLIDALADHAHVGEVRGDGLLAAVEFVKNKDDRALFDPAEKVGPRLAAALWSAASSPAPCRRARSWALLHRFA